LTVSSNQDNTLNKTPVRYGSSISNGNSAIPRVCIIPIDKLNNQLVVSRRRYAPNKVEGDASCPSYNSLGINGTAINYNTSPYFSSGIYEYIDPLFGAYAQVSTYNNPAGSASGATLDSTFMTLVVGSPMNQWFTVYGGAFIDLSASTPTPSVS
jgi:hypothetical protein